MTILAPETEAREALIALLRVEFEPEGFTDIRDDKIHGSLGKDGTVLAVYPGRSVPWSRNNFVQDSEVVVQFYGRYDLEVNAEQRVSPKKIEEYAERFRRRLQESDPRTPDVWYFKLLRVEYPDDPTGNKTRFEAYVQARGNNNALLETS